MADATHDASSNALPWWRFSLKQLLLATAYVALGCVALRNANTTWVGAMLGLTWIALAASLLLAMYRDGQDRAFWVGFAVAGWLYLLLPVFGWSFMAHLQGNTVITTRISHWAYNWLYPEPVSGTGFGTPMTGSMPMGSGGAGMYPDAMSGYGSAMGTSGGSMGGPGGPPGMGMGGMASGMSGPSFPTFTGPTQQDFTNVSHALWTLLLAFCGGWFAQWLYATRGRRSDAAASSRP